VSSAVLPYSVAHNFEPLEVLASIILLSQIIAPDIHRTNCLLDNHPCNSFSTYESTYKTQSTWPTQLAAALAVEDSVTEDEVIVDAATVDVDEEDQDVEETSQKRRNGSQSPSWVDSSRPARSQAWSKSTCTLCPSRSTRL
jgi:hypothetical protein